MSAQQRADRAFEAGAYVDAADRYAALVDAEPQDAPLRVRRDEARRLALAQLAAQIHELRATGRLEPALAALSDLLTRRHAWRVATPAETLHVIADEVDTARHQIADEVQRLVDHKEPLAAEKLIAARRAQLGFDELAGLWTDVDRLARDAGAAICRAAEPDDVEHSPYLARLAAEYCRHFGIAARVPDRLPGRIAAVVPDGEVSGMTAAQRTRLAAALEAALYQTAWFDPKAGDVRGRVVLAGTQAATFTTAEVTLTAGYMEDVSYTEQEMYQEPYQESYQEAYQEPYTVQVPYTEYRTESYSCGYGSTTTTCTRTVATPSTRSETQYRTAYRTAHRTAYRPAWRTVHKSRLEPRSFTYPAVERIGNYSATWNLAIELGPDAPPLAIRIVKTDRKSGYDHEQHFAPTYVAASEIELPSFDAWFGQVLAELRAALPARLAAHWSAAYCRAPSYDAESAARCAYGGRPPTAARAALAGVFRTEVDGVIARFATAPSAR